ncbi:hypothetical protein DUI87_15607 [Hirundo rustica rustica]|uniref:GED domain-containing protein n=1 Tax=Hirundo rustica rustica TaxID=333673 RepID=A0A3M0KGD2_HIRRU|nr:hypothetical protein DUI87_15607 [Hirundo rustica rustica]
MDKKKPAFKQPFERTKNTPKKEGFLFSVPEMVKPFPEAATVPLPPEPEETAELSEDVFEKRPNHEQDLEKEVFREEDKQAGEHTLYNQYEEKIRPCIDLVDSLRALGIEKDLSLPAIAVIGDQSSGKSSVLEALSGVALPRGNGIVTRCPLELKLKRLPEGQAWQGKISYRNVTLELQNPSEVDRAIRQAQDIVAGTRGAISGQLISLEVRSPDVPDLTLIDLPGIARVAVGDQPKDIGDQHVTLSSAYVAFNVARQWLILLEIVTSYKQVSDFTASPHRCIELQIKILLKRIIGCKETVNLVVVPCNVDIATTEALKMAQEVDPTGERTIGILTKPDLVDRGTEEAVVKILRNRVIPLKKGYMIVKCRGQQDIHNKLTLAAAIQQERHFFENHKHFRAIMEEGKATIPHLAEKLTNELVQHIILIKLFNQEISRSTRGEEQLLGDEVRLFTRIRKEFRTWGVILLECAARAKKTIPGRVWKYEDQYRGREFPGFTNYRTFEDIIQEQIRELEEPAMNILNNVMKLVEEKFMELAMKNFANFHNLSRVAKVKIEDIREKQAAEAERHIRAQFKMERIVYCQDDLYVGDLNAVKAENALGASLGKDPHNFPSPKDSSVVLEMLSHTSAYFSGASKRLSNQIPLIILSTVLQDFGENVQTSMLQLLQDKEKLNFLLEEDSEAAKVRNYLSQRVDRLTKACQYLREFSLL